jgi:hypothetical protein
MRSPLPVLVLAVALGSLASLTACPDSGERPFRLWLDAQEGTTAVLTPDEPATY